MGDGCGHISLSAIFIVEREQGNTIFVAWKEALALVSFASKQVAAIEQVLLLLVKGWPSPTRIVV